MTFLWRQIVTAQWSHRASRWTAAALLLTASSCSAVSRPMTSSSTDPFLDDDRAAAVASNTKPVSRQAAKPPAPTATRRNDIVLAAHETEYRPGQIPRTKSGLVAAGVPGIMPPGDACPAWQDCPPCEEAPAGCATRYPDEYVFDGGDHGPLSLEHNQIHGLQPED